MLKRVMTGRHQPIYAALIAVCLAQSSAHAQTLCVFDPMGAAGDAYALMKDFTIVAKSQGVDLELIPYRSEEAITAFFASKECDSIAVTDFMARQFNSYTGSMNAIGGILNNGAARAVLSIMGNPKLDAEMVNGDYEVAGVFPLGMAYVAVNDRQINNMSKAQGRRFAVLASDRAQYDMVKKIGAVPVPVTVSNMGNVFNSGQVDIMGAIALSFTALELHKGMGNKGAMFQFPVTFVSMNIIVRKSAFPTGFARDGRRWFASQTNRMMLSADRLERSIPKRYWAELGESEKAGYVQLMRDMRIQLVKEGVYNQKMISLLKKVRCQQEPKAAECQTTDE